MSFTEILTWCMAIFAMLGGLDRIFGGRLGLGNEFTKALFTMGPLVLSMVGMLILTPVIVQVLGPVITPAFLAIGADPAVLAGMLLSLDSGAVPLAEALAKDPQSGLFAGCIISSMLGETVAFHIPVAMEIAGAEGSYLARGMVVGLIPIPLGCVIGGLAAGFPLGLVLHDTLPVLILSLLLILGLLKFREALVRGFLWLGRFIQGVAIVGLLLGILQSLTGLTPIRGIASAEEAFGVVATIAICLAGAFPLMHVLTRLLRKPLTYAGRLLGMNEPSMTGPLLTLVNTIPMLEAMKDMNPRGKVMNAAFCVTGAFAFGDFFGYLAAVQPAMLVPMIIGKLAAGIVSIALAILTTRGEAEAADGVVSNIS